MSAIGCQFGLGQAISLKISSCKITQGLYTCWKVLEEKKFHCANVFQVLACVCMSPLGQCNHMGEPRVEGSSVNIEEVWVQEREEMVAVLQSSQGHCSIARVQMGGNSFM